MAGAPTYQDINRKRIEDSAMQSQMDQRTAVANDPRTMGTPNPVLAEYMNRNVQPMGLVPNASIAQPNQEEYGLIMANAAMQGKVPMEAVLADNKIPDQIKGKLINTLRNTGLGQLG